jgi:molybdopterin synthase catalytic subunit|tara:strand:+ start:147 stop:551 length:405 start_codon:yes stop_codon:yes gene_type:complete
MIKIQQQDFDLEKEISAIKFKYSSVGAVSTFIGYVRDINNNKEVTSIDLEVYQEMAFSSLEKIIEEAKKKWSLIDSLVIHRYGQLNISEKIVLVATFSMHRNDSIASCNYIIDFLKKDAPFWKKEFYNEKFNWL